MHVKQSKILNKHWINILRKKFQTFPSKNLIITMKLLSVLMHFYRNLPKHASCFSRRKLNVSCVSECFQWNSLQFLLLHFSFLVAVTKKNPQYCYLADTAFLEQNFYPNSVGNDFYKALRFYVLLMTLIMMLMLVWRQQKCFCLDAAWDYRFIGTDDKTGKPNIPKWKPAIVPIQRYTRVSFLFSQNCSTVKL